MTYTKGPWYVDPSRQWQILRRTEKTNLIRVASANKAFNNCAANAKLIAAAPDLLEACKAMMEGHEAPSEGVDSDRAWNVVVMPSKQALTKAYHAIARATGETDA